MTLQMHLSFPPEFLGFEDLHFMYVLLCLLFKLCYIIFLDNTRPVKLVFLLITTDRVLIKVSYFTLYLLKRMQYV